MSVGAPGIYRQSITSPIQCQSIHCPPIHWLYNVGPHTACLTLAIQCRPVHRLPDTGCTMSAYTACLTLAIRTSVAGQYATAFISTGRRSVTQSGRENKMKVTGNGKCPKQFICQDLVSSWKESLAEKERKNKEDHSELAGLLATSSETPPRQLISRVLFLDTGPGHRFVAPNHRQLDADSWHRLGSPGFVSSSKNGIKAWRNPLYTSLFSC
jgi:hypothetical protein